MINWISKQTYIAIKKSPSESNFEYYLLTLDTRDNGPLLDGGGLLETIGIDSPEQSLAQVHIIKTVHDLVPVALQGEKEKEREGMLENGGKRSGKKYKIEDRVT